MEDGLESMEGASGGELAALHQVMPVRGARELNLWTHAPGSFQVGVTMLGYWGFPSLYFIVHRFA